MITRAADAHAAHCEAAKRLHGKRVELAHAIDCAIAEVLRAGTILLLQPGAGSIVGWLKLRSGTRSMPVAQAAGRVFGIVLT